MNTNLKSGNAVVRILLAHGEKIGIAAIGICTALIIWSAIGREYLERKPEELTSLEQTTNQRLASYKWTELPEEERLLAKAVPPSTMPEVSSEVFPVFPISMDRELTAPISLRMDPGLLTPIDLEVNSDLGLWASANPEEIKARRIAAKKEEERKQNELDKAREEGEREGGPRGPAGGGRFGGRGGPGVGPDTKVARDAPIVRSPRTGIQLDGFERITAKSWVTVLAKIPIKKQTLLYEEALRNARGYKPEIDIPTYVGYQVERAEVTSKGLSEWTRVATINKKRLIGTIATYPVNVPDVIDPDVKHPLLTHPLPPLILREWGNRISHSSMPLAADKPPASMEALEEPTEELGDEKAKPADDEPFADTGARGSEDLRARGGIEYGRGDAERGYGRGGRGERFGGEMIGREGGYARGGGEGRFGGGEMGYGGRGGSRGMGSEVTLEKFVWDQETPFLLLRYFDNSVKSGRSYRYRIRLGLQDVNHEVKEQYLDKTVSLRRKDTGSKSYRWTEWSKQSPVASVPLPARIYLVDSKPAKASSFTAEPELGILIKALNSEHAAEVSRLESFDRGGVINIYDKATVVVTSKKFDLSVSPSFRFLTRITVLNFLGGESLKTKKREQTVPTRALLMDAAGHLFVQNELDDIETVTEFETIVEEGKDNKIRGGRGGGMEGGRGFGGMEGSRPGMERIGR